MSILAGCSMGKEPDDVVGGKFTSYVMHYATFVEGIYLLCRLCMEIDFIH
jgi:hypothetical protein